METGLKGRQTATVTDDKTAKALGSGKLEVYATPAMIALVENTASGSVEEFLEEGEGTVGTLINIKHVSATPVGKKIVCETILTEVDRRRLVFECKVFDEAGLIGEGIHERFVIENKKFMEKAENK